MITCAGFYWYYWLRLIQSPLPATASLIDACLKKNARFLSGVFFFRQAFVIRYDLFHSTRASPDIFVLKGEIGLSPQ